MNIADVLAETTVTDLDLSRYVRVSPDTSIRDTVETMSEADRSCACVVDGEELVGIFTQRDVLLRVIGRTSVWDKPVSDEMTKTVRTMRDDQTVSDGLAVMNDWWVRSVPVVDENKNLMGSLSFYTVMKLIADQLTARLGDKAIEPEVQHGLSFVDFTGLHFHPPVVVNVEDTVDIAAHQMKARGIGSVLVVDDRENLVGVLTEFDLQTKVGCDRADLEAIPVKDVMTPDPTTLRARASIADAIREIADLGFSHVPLVGESGRPVGVASFRDIAAFVETSLESLG